MIGALVYLGSSYCLKACKIDDVIDATPVHYFCGVWGVLATGLFASPRIMDKTLTDHESGLFYGGSTLLGWQIAGIVAISAWTAAVTLVFLAPMHFMGYLRISDEEEMLGLDAYYAMKGVTSISTPKSSRESKLKKGNQEAAPAIKLDILDEPTSIGIRMEASNVEASNPVLVEKTLGDGQFPPGPALEEGRDGCRTGCSI